MEKKDEQQPDFVFTSKPFPASEKEYLLSLLHDPESLIHFNKLVKNLPSSIPPLQTHQNTKSWTP